MPYTDQQYHSLIKYAQLNPCSAIEIETASRSGRMDGQIIIEKGQMKGKICCLFSTCICCRWGFPTIEHSHFGIWVRIVISFFFLTAATVILTGQMGMVNGRMNGQ